MRETHRCPKCSHDEILFVPQLADRDDRDIVRPLVLHVLEFGWKDDVEFGILQAYACRKCGYTELYTKDVGSIPTEKLPRGSVVLKPRGTK